MLTPLFSELGVFPSEFILDRLYSALLSPDFPTNQTAVRQCIVELKRLGSDRWSDKDREFVAAYVNWSLERTDVCGLLTEENL